MRESIHKRSCDGHTRRMTDKKCKNNKMNMNRPMETKDDGFDNR